MAFSPSSSFPFLWPSTARSSSCGSRGGVRSCAAFLRGGSTEEAAVGYPSWVRDGTLLFLSHQRGPLLPIDRILTALHNKFLQATNGNGEDHVLLPVS